MSRRNKNRDDARIEALWSRHFSGRQISIMDIGKVFTAARNVIAANGDDAAVVRAMDTTWSLLP